MVNMFRFWGLGIGAGLTLGCATWLMTKNFQFAGLVGAGSALIVMLGLHYGTKSADATPLEN